jgi:hypothetical protein
MFSSLLNAMFGCSHKRTTFPITPARRTQLSADSARRGTYVVCLDCGKEFDYSWKDMKISDGVISAAHASSLTAVNH